MAINERIKELRKKEGLTQKQFAERILVTQTYLSKIETGVEVPTDKFVKLVSLEFGASLEWLNNLDSEDGSVFPTPTLSNTTKLRKQALENLDMLLDEVNNGEVDELITLIINGLLQTFKLYNGEISPKQISLLHALTKHINGMLTTIDIADDINSVEKIEKTLSTLKFDNLLDFYKFFDTIGEICEISLNADTAE